MRDLIWTIIIVWVLWRLIDAFKAVSARTTRVNSNSHGPQDRQQTYRQTSADSYSNPPKKGHLKADAGEYVDYEETK